MTTLSLATDERRSSSFQDGATDAQLLERFVQQKDEAAFEELVRRHGAMVLGVCRRVLHNPHDAEDCFQAAFLVLVRKATSIWPREMVGNWLYGVAYRTALEARKMAARRREMERKKQTIPSQPPSDLWQDLRPVLDQELNRLPDKYRSVLILCDLEGKTRSEAALQLGLPEGTVASRLSRARALLEKRLAKHALTFSAETLPVVLIEQTAETVPPALAASTVRAALHAAAGKATKGLISSKVADLTEGVVQSLAVPRAKIALAVAVLGLVLLGIGIGAFIPAAKANRQPRPGDGLFSNTPKPTVFLQDCILRKVDWTNRTLHAEKLDPAGGSTDGFDLQVEPATQIFIDGRERRFDDLQLGLRVNVSIERLPEGKHRALRIEAVGENVQGVVIALNENDVTIRLEDEENYLAEKTYPLEKTAPVVIDGKKAKLADLKSKMKVSLQVSALKPIVVSVHAAGPSISGVVKVIDARLHAISVHLKNTHLAVEDIAVAPDASVIIAGKSGKLTDLKTGMPVRLQMSAETDKSVVVGITTAQPIKR